jgi:hypothetical protein
VAGRVLAGSVLAGADRECRGADGYVCDADSTCYPGESGGPAGMGDVGGPSGAFVTASNKVKDSASTPADECTALADAVGRVDYFRTLAEEYAGVRTDRYNHAARIDGSPPATPIYAADECTRAANSHATGDTACTVRTETLVRLQRARAASPCAAHRPKFGYS